MGKDIPKIKSSEKLTGAIIGASVAGLIAICAGIFFVGGLNERINLLSNKISEIEVNNKTVNSGLTLTNNILTRILNHVDISENEKIAIYKEIDKTITEVTKSITLNTSTQNQTAMKFKSQNQTNSAEPEYIKTLVRWSKYIKPSADRYTPPIKNKDSSNQ